MDLDPAFRATLELLPEPMLLVDVETRILAANAAIARHLRRASQALVGARLTDLAHEPPEGVRSYLASCLRSGQLLLGALTLRLEDGESITFRAAGGALRLGPSSGLPRAVLLRLTPRAESRVAFLALDDKIQELNAEIARRQMVERDLRRERETLQVTLGSIGDAVIVTDAEGRISFINSIGESLLGAKLEECRGKALLDVFRIANEVTLQAIEDPVQRVFRTGFVVGPADDTILIRADGSTLPIDDTASPIHLGGEIIGAVLIFRDVSVRRQAEAALRDADRRKDEFLATLAHELRNPLAPIRNALQILAMSAHDPGRSASARAMVERQLKHMVRLIDDLMDVSRITQGRLELRQERVDLDTVVQVAVETSRPLVDTRHQNLRIQRAAEPFHVDADITRLAQVFSNLLNNSAKYSPPGADISIATQREGDHVIISVTDTGIGIAPDMLERVFEMFVQVQRQGVRDGLGIGLTLVKRIVELHGGTIVARSGGEGRGSTFQVRLALAPPRNAEDPVIVRPVRSARARILVADDNRDAAQSLAVLLQLEGHEVEIAFDGVEALRKAEQFRPQIALLDIGMPNMDGHLAARRIRERPWGDSVRLIALTGWGQEDDRRDAAAAGFDRHLVKPVDPVALIHLLAEILPP